MCPLYLSMLFKSRKNTALNSDKIRIRAEIIRTILKGKGFNIHPDLSSRCLFRLDELLSQGKYSIVDLAPLLEKADRTIVQAIIVYLEFLSSNSLLHEFKNFLKIYNSGIIDFRSDYLDYINLYVEKAIYSKDQQAFFVFFNSLLYLDFTPNKVCLCLDTFLPFIKEPKFPFASKTRTENNLFTFTLINFFSKFKKFNKENIELLEIILFSLKPQERISFLTQGGESKVSVLDEFLSPYK